MFISWNVSAQDDAIRIDTISTVNAPSRQERQLYKGYEKGNFEIFEGNETEIGHFRPKTRRFIRIVYDMQTEEQTANVLEALRRSPGSSAKSDYFVTFLRSRRLTTDFVPTSAQIATNLESGKPNSLYDAIVAASEKATAEKRETCFACSDRGDDNSSRTF